jgi:transposase-like protein
VRRRVGRFSEARRQEILQIAAREGLTGAQVAKRFGISQVTYYIWRKRVGASSGGHRARTGSAAGLIGGMEGTIRAQVRSAIQAMLPQLIEEEVAAALEGAGRGGSRR